jgi:ATP-dependent RNA helicase DDX31/DBP7
VVKTTKAAVPSATTETVKPSDDVTSKRKPDSQPSDININKKFRPTVPGGFVSSLFTSNPETVLPQTTATTIIQPAIPVFSDSTFPGLGLHHLLSQHLEQKLKVQTPTPIQRASIPHLIKNNQDAIIQAQTGSGKTYSFLLPLLNRLIVAASNATSRDKSFFSRATGTFCIVLAPTRELAQQISAVLEKLLNYSAHTEANDEGAKSQEIMDKYHHWIVSGIVTGGEKRSSEKARLRKGNTILVCTPGRLLDHLKTTESFAVGNVRWLVLDEADNLLSLGFEETLKEILAILDEKRYY